MQDGTADLCPARPNSPARTNFPVQLTTSRIGNQPYPGLINGVLSYTRKVGARAKNKNPRAKLALAVLPPRKRERYVGASARHFLLHTRTMQKPISRTPKYPSCRVANKICTTSRQWMVLLGRKLAQRGLALLFYTINTTDCSGALIIISPFRVTGHYLTPLVLEWA